MIYAIQHYRHPHNHRHNTWTITFDFISLLIPIHIYPYLSISIHHLHDSSVSMEPSAAPCRPWRQNSVKTMSRRPRRRRWRCDPQGLSWVVHKPSPSRLRLMKSAWFGTWLLFEDLDYFSINIGNSNPSWLSYFSEGFKLQTRNG